MQAIHRFSDHYIEPIIFHPVTQVVSKVVVEIIKIIAIKTFLTYLGNRYLNHPQKISQREIYEIVVLAPLKEELFFRLGVLQAIHLLQKILILSKKKIQLVSPFEASVAQHTQSTSPFNVCLAPVEYILYCGSIRVLSLISSIVRAIFSRIHVISVFADESPQSEGWTLPLHLPLEQSILYHTIKKGICLLKGSSPEREEKMTEEERIQQVFRIHLAALIFAAAHLSASHPNRIDALTQFSWSFIGGIIYGYLAEKYQSLAPGIVFHGLNNFIAVSSIRYSKDKFPCLLLALLVNRFVACILAFTQIDKIEMLRSESIRT